MTERKASMGDKVYRGDVIKFIRNNITLGTFMKRTVKTANEACWDLCDKLNYVPAIEDKNEPHWIPVTEEPIPDGEYLVTWTSEIQEKPILSIICRYSGVWDCWELQMLGHQDINVLAYMELPEAYQPSHQSAREIVDTAPTVIEVEGSET